MKMSRDGACALAELMDGIDRDPHSYVSIGVTG